MWGRWMDRYRNSLIPIAEQTGVSWPYFPLLQDTASSAGLWDAGTYLPDDIMVKVDRASMANSLETRAPLLDHRIIEFAYRLPVEFKLQKGVNKRVLRELLYRQVPKQIVDRPKMGFSIPLSNWLKRELRPWAEEEINRISATENFDKKAVLKIWDDHQSGKDDNTGKIWGLLSLGAFLKK